MEIVTGHAIAHVRAFTDPGALTLLGYTREAGGAVATSDILRVDLTLKVPALYRCTGLVPTCKDAGWQELVDEAVRTCKPRNARLWLKSKQHIYLRLHPDVDNMENVGISAYRVASYGMDAMKHMGEDMADIYDDVRRLYKGDLGTTVLYNFLYSLSIQKTEAGVSTLLKEAGDMAKPVKAAFKAAGIGTAAKSIFKYITQAKQ